MADYESGTTWRSVDGCARIAYRPDWSEGFPFVTYKRGIAGQHYRTLRAAMQGLVRCGFRFG